LDVLTRVKYCGICGTDLSILGGDMSLIRDGFIKYPVRIGHEWSGIVEKVGREVNNVRPGDRVIGDNGVSCGECEDCREGNYHLCAYARAVGTCNCWDGAFAEYMLMPWWHMHKLPENIELDEAALIEPASVAYNGLINNNIGRKTVVLIIGTGSIGLSATGIAKSMGAGKVLLAGRKKNKLDVGKIMGADDVVNVTTDSLHDFVMQKTGNKGANLIVETSGSISCIEQAIDLIHTRGTLSLLGFYETDLSRFNVDKLVCYAARIHGVGGFEGTMPQVIQLATQGSLKLKPMITHRVHFDEAVDAFKTANQKNETKIKIMVEM
jgi:2-desacetyl-2-hydroxyethyl bacteriochlorophyllide A dehydrogenase